MPLVHHHLRMFFRRLFLWLYLLNNEEIIFIKSFQPIVIEIIELTKPEIVIIIFKLVINPLCSIFVYFESDIKPNHFIIENGKVMINLTPNEKHRNGLKKLFFVRFIQFFKHPICRINISSQQYVAVLYLSKMIEFPKSMFLNDGKKLIKY